MSLQYWLSLSPVARLVLPWGLAMNTLPCSTIPRHYFYFMTPGNRTGGAMSSLTPWSDTVTLMQLKTTVHCAAYAGVHPTYDINKFWHNHVDILVCSYCQLYSQQLLRGCFPLLKQSFSDGQTGVLRGLLETSVMLQINNHEV